MTHTPIKHLLLGLTGGIAAYKSAELVRLLVKRGVEVQVVMTEAAQRFITPATLQALSHKRVLTDLWHDDATGAMPHIALSRQADAILIAPASADFIARLAHGLADDLLATLCLARDCPLLIAPAMNRQMWENPATQRNVEQLRADGITLLGPDSGDQACGETGPGRMLEPAAILDLLLGSEAARPLDGKRVLVTAGPTMEAIDPVRAITNFSSGKMGYAIARAARALGATVTLVSGPTRLQRPDGIDTIDVVSAAQMLDAVLQRIADQDVFVSVAAVADYRPARPSGQKLKKSQQALTLTLEPTTDILATVAALPQPPFCVGFAAESEHLLEHAAAKRERKGIPLIVANLVQQSLGRDSASVVLLDDRGRHALPNAPKSEIARRIMLHVAALLSPDEKTHAAED